MQQRGTVDPHGLLRLEGKKGLKGPNFGQEVYEWCARSIPGCKNKEQWQIILSRVSMTKDGVRIGNCIY
jgi:hypothetical protein